jgi:hypothetical protein
MGGKGLVALVLEGDSLLLGGRHPRWVLYGATLGEQQTCEGCWLNIGVTILNVVYRVLNDVSRIKIQDRGVIMWWQALRNPSQDMVKLRSSSAWACANRVQTTRLGCMSERGY